MNADFREWIFCKTAWEVKIPVLSFMESPLYLILYGKSTDLSMKWRKD